ncbi:MAG: response regulator [Proteobacteria bacterium]|nr:response regulator [Pseudomonadota bacterium]
MTTHNTKTPTKVLKPSIMIVEDEESIASVLKYGLQRDGYSVRVVYNGEDAMTEALSNKPDLVLLDRMLPGVSGIEVCRMLRECPETANIPIIMVSAKGEEFDRITGLDHGADDYIVKPFSPAELAARIKAVFRRMRPAFSGKVLRFADIEMDLSSYSVTRNGQDIKLAPIEFQILQILLEQPNRVLSREMLIDKIWGPDVYVGARTVDVHITRLRKSLLKYSTSGEDVIKTVRLAGYTLRSITVPSPEEDDEIAA